MVLDAGVSNAGWLTNATARRQWVNYAVCAPAAWTRGAHAAYSNLSPASVERSLIRSHTQLFQRYRRRRRT